MSLLYHFNHAEHAQTNIENRRLKIAKIDELNDPFEVKMGFDWDPELEAELTEGIELLREDMTAQLGLLCFSATWKSLLMWGHYADKHTGICMGFDFIGPKETLRNVEYRTDRFTVNTVFLETIGDEWEIEHCDNVESLPDASTPTEKDLQRLYRELFASKHLGWSYEEEIRLLTPLSDTKELDEKGNQFDQWSAQQLVLKEVILGVGCKKSVSEIEKWLTGQTGVTIYEARLHNSEFQLNRNEVGSC